MELEEIPLHFYGAPPTERELAEMDLEEVAREVERAEKAVWERWS